MVAILKMVSIEVVIMILTQTTHYAEKFQNSVRCQFSHRSIAGQWKLVTEEKIYCGVFRYAGTVEARSIGSSTQQKENE
jgi:hypothetical protein